ncbi:NAD(P)-dependent oxidoreductase [Vibrio sp. SS-MA-C1-2]|uniref:NAD(P)-dependent oxidoreductase n=1 Tax=Vibrio sp. SS-MA-C1-2 TaxID=2908646 RepID=UPI0038FC0B62
MTTKVAFIGLGVMGYPMAGHLSQKGFNTTVYNRTTSKAQKWCEEFTGTWAKTPAIAVRDADIVFVCVGNDDDVRSVFYGNDGLLSTVKPDTIIVDHTTTSATLAKELAQAANKQHSHFLDAPVSGGQAGAENGVLTVMVGGNPTVLEQATPAINSYAKAISLMGENGAGQQCKMANQVCIAGILQGLSEAIKLAQAAGLDIEQMSNVLKHGAAGSWQMENRAATMDQDQFDFGFAIDWMRKDLDICLDEAKNLNVELPLTKQVNETYEKLQQRGLNRCDTSVLIKQFDKK